MKFLRLFILVLAISSCSVEPEKAIEDETWVRVESASMDLCEVLDRPLEFDGKEIDTRAILIVGFESSLLYDPRCVSEDRLIWFESLNNSVHDELGNYINPETDEFREMGLNRVAGRYVGVFQTRKGQGFGHLNSSNHLITVTQVAEPSTVPSDVPYPWSDSRVSMPGIGAPDPNSPFIYFEQAIGECPGRCPAFKLAVFSDGRLAFEGGENTKVKGMIWKKLSEPELEEIIEPFRRASLAEMQDVYKRERNCSFPVLSDSPIVTLSFREGDTNKQITHYTGCYSKSGNIGRLVSLERSVEAYLKRRSWIE